MSDDEWTLDVLDLDAYLSRIGFTRPLATDAATLTSLHRAHVAAVPFENLDVILGRGISVDLDRVQDKLVRDRRGGYCYEHGLLFAAVLDRVGFPVQRLLARVGPDHTRPGPRTHMTLIVTADGRPWMADVGFGSGLLESVPLRTDAVNAQGDWTYRVMSPAAQTWQLQELQGEQWIGQYTVEEQMQHHADVVMSNHYTSTWPQSPFVLRPVVVRKDEHAVQRLLGRELSSIRPGSEPETRQLSDDQYGSALHELGLELPTGDVSALLAAIDAHATGLAERDSDAESTDRTAYEHGAERAKVRK